MRGFSIVWAYDLPRLTAPRKLTLLFPGPLGHAAVAVLNAVV